MDYCRHQELEVKNEPNAPPGANGRPAAPGRLRRCAMAAADRLGDSEVLGGTTAPLSRSGGLLSPALSSKGGEGDQSIGWWQCQAPLAVVTCVERASELQHPARNEY